MRAAYTIATPDYISYAKTLGESVFENNSEYKFYIFLIGDKSNIDQGLDLNKISVISVEEMNDHVIQQMRVIYDDFELSCALKPFCAEYLINSEFKPERVKYFDSDIMVFNSFDKDLEDSTYSIFLTPHFTRPVDPTVHQYTNDISLITRGTYNAGYFEVDNSDESKSFLRWWKNRMAIYCYKLKSPNPELFVDQSWLTLVPLYFKNVNIISHPGYNLAPFNLHERTLGWHNEEFTVDSKYKLVFFHFTGYKYYNHAQAFMYTPDINYQNTPFLEKLCLLYRSRLIENGAEKTAIPPPKEVDTKREKLELRSLHKRFGTKMNNALGKVIGIKIVKSI